MNKTWFIDIDGPLVRHLENKEIDEGTKEELLPYVLEFMKGLKREVTVLYSQRQGWKNIDK